ncbi:peptidase E [Bacillus sonorensis]|uniref:peptidase E n=1 Tax=Bacillus sonorensis TaxID=119858 RepID=UPI000494FDA7|nr:peptidase E [Bacillus sonorensis]MEC1588819.1 peptidase E [Bacillus sonorensis]
MRKLFFSGGGDREQTRTIDQRFAEEIDKEKPLLYIPAAMDASRFPDCFRWIQGVFQPLGLHDIIMWTNLKGKSIRDLKEFSAVYIGGGNTFRLLKHVTDTRFIDILKDYVEQGGIIYGGSAGAIIFGKNIMTCSHMDDNDAGIRDVNGLGLTDEYSIWCHYHHEDDPLIKAFMKQYDTPVISLPEETAILVEDTGIQVIGTKPAYVFRGEDRTVIHENDVIKKSST